MKIHRWIIRFVFLCLIVVVALQIRCLGEDRWWQCDLTASFPLYNITHNSRHELAVAVKMRTSLSETCWTAKELDSSMLNGTYIPSPVKACLTRELYHRRLKKSSAEGIDNAKSVFYKTKICLILALVFSSLGLTFQLANICLLNGIMTITQTALSFFAWICTLPGIIIFDQDVKYDALFNKYDTTLLPVLLTQDRSLPKDGAKALEIFFDMLLKRDVYKDNYETGAAFVMFWISFIILFLVIIISIIGHCIGRNANDSKYNSKPSLGGGGFGGGGGGVFDFDDDD